MDGVTILNSYKTLTEASAIWLAFGVVCAISMFAGGLSILIASVNRKDRMLAAVVFAAAFAVSTLLYLFIYPVQYYEVIIDKNVRWKDFTEHYEVKNARGKILTVREVKDD